MFCPLCKSEYREGYRVCSDCDVELVEELPPEAEVGYIGYDEVLSTFNPGDIAIIKSVLDTEGITYFFQGEHFTYVIPLALQARLMVKKDQVEQARELLKDLKLSCRGINVAKNSGENEDNYLHS